MPDLAAVVQALTARVTELEDRLAIAQLVASYGPAADSGSADAAAAIWTEDSYFDAAPGLRFDGPAAIAEHIATEPHLSTMAGGAAHVLSAPLIEIDVDRATAFNYSQVMYRDHASDAYRTSRVASNRWELVRTPNGWKVTKRVARPLDGNDEARGLFRGAFEATTDG